MKIELTIKRKGGTRLSLLNEYGRKVNYHFAPQPDGAHVADVENEDHAKLMLGIPEYRPYGEAAAHLMSEIVAEAKAAAAEAAKVAEAEQAALATSEPEDVDPLEIDQMDRPMLASAHEIVFGEKAHPKAKIETLRAKISAEIEANAEAEEKFEAFAMDQAKKHVV